MRNKTNLILPALFLVFLGLFCGCATTPGTLEITSSPSQAPVYLDNQYRGITPLTLSGVSPGTHTLEVRLNGYEIWSTTGTMDNGEYVVVEASLDPVSLPDTAPTAPPAPAPAPDIQVSSTPDPFSRGSLIVASKPGNAEVYIDSVYRGKSPLTLKDIPLGTYGIRVSMAGYEDWLGEGTVSPLSTTTISATLTALPRTWPTTTVTTPQTPAPWTPSPEPWIIIDPIPDVSGGKVFEIKGTTNLVDYTSLYVLVRDSRGLAVVHGSTLARDGSFRFWVDPHSFTPGLYQAEVSSYGVIATRSIVVYP